tara:strand:+ start:434 stop:661 length:228 start_codon:yes stop_codon:yes gene_type:complete
MYTIYSAATVEVRVANENSMSGTLFLEYRPENRFLCLGCGDYVYLVSSEIPQDSTGAWKMCECWIRMTTTTFALL